MWLPTSIVRVALLFALVTFSHTATSHGQAVKQLTAEQLAEEWDRLGRRQQPFEISKANEFDLSGPKPVKMVVSADASTLLVLDEEGGLVFWDLTSGVQLKRVVPEQASAEAAIDLSDNGKEALVGFPSGLIQIYMTDREKPRVQFDAYKTPLTMVQFSADQGSLIAVDKFGKTWEVDMKGQSKGFRPGPSEDTPVDTLVAAGGQKDTWWKITIDEDKVGDVYFDGEEESENNLELEPPTRVDSSGDRMLLLSDKQLAWVDLRKTDMEEFEAKFSQISLDSPIYDAKLVPREPLMWTVSQDQLQLRDIYFGQVKKSMPLPTDLDPQHTHACPIGNALVTVTPEGHVTRWMMYMTPDGSMKPLLTSLSFAFRNQRFDAFEALAAKWNGRTKHFENDAHETSYTYLMRVVQRYALSVQDQDVKKYANIETWIRNHPENCKFMRIALFRLYLADGYKARGQGFANSVTEDGWKVFYANMEKSWEVLEPLFDQKDVPAEGYTSAIIAGKNLQWDRDVINQYLRQAFEKYPTYHRTFTEEAVARLPRWGGEPGETEYLARFTADKIGGKQGDILYAQIAQHVSRFVGWDNIDIETGFKRERILNGLLAIMETSENQKTINLGLYLGVKWDNEEVGMAATTRLVDLMSQTRDVPAGSKETIAKQLYERAKQDQSSDE